MNRESADAFESRGHLAIAPTEFDDLSRTSCQIPVSAEATESRLVGARHDDIGTNPILAIANCHVLPGLFTADRRDRAVDVVFDANDTGVALRLIGDRHLASTEKLSDKDRQQMRGPADTAGENPGQPLHGICRSMVID